MPAIPLGKVPEEWLFYLQGSPHAVELLSFG
jgi:hypothetical protein